MCGIAGLLSSTIPMTSELVRTMTDRIQPRGPDSSGHWIGDNGRIGFGHRKARGRGAGLGAGLGWRGRAVFATVALRHLKPPAKGDIERQGDEQPEGQ